MTRALDRMLWRDVIALRRQSIAIALLIDLPPTGKPMPGDGWRVGASIVVESLTDVLVVPAGVLVRPRGSLQVFVIEGSVARARTATLGGINARAACMRDGVWAGENLVMHPPDALVDGGPIRLRRKPDAQ
jgi:HlyD family secretion protein